MLDLIVKLTAIYNYAKDIHYRAKGESFYSTHLLMDKICDDINDQIDELKEVYYLGNTNLPPRSADILKIVYATIPEYSENIRTEVQNLGALVQEAITSTREVATYNGSNGVQSLVDDIARSLMLKNGLIQRTLAA